MKFINVLVGVCCLTTALLSADLSSVKVGGTVMSVFNNFEQKSGSRTQFDFAGNLDVSASVHPQWELFMQLQASPGNGSLGFPGPQSELTDINLTYQSPYQNLSFVMGSFDMPFGLQVAHLTNNADSFANNFVTNDLLYSMFAGPVGTLNTVGVKADYQWANYNFTAALTNGTDESAQKNDESSFAVLAGVSSPVTEKLTLGLTTLRSQETYQTDADAEAGRAATASNFNTEFTGVIADLKYQWCSKWGLNAYAALLNYDDGVSTTEDQVQSYMLELVYDNVKYYRAYRVSAWMPNDHDGNATGTSRSLLGRTPGFAESVNGVFPLADQQVFRYESVVGYRYSEDILMKLQASIDDYTKRTNSQSTRVYTALATINVRF